ISNLVSIADQLNELGHAVDSVRLYNEVLSDENRLQLVRRWGGSGDQFKQRAQQGLSKALHGLKPETLPAALRELLRPRANARASDPVVDLALMVQPRDLQRASITSMLATTLRAVASQSKLKSEIKSTMEDLRKKHESDLSIHVAAVLVAFAEKSP